MRLGTCCGACDDNADGGVEGEDVLEEGGYDGVVGGLLDSGDGEDVPGDAGEDTKGDIDSLSDSGVDVGFEGNNEGTEAVIESGSSVLGEPFTCGCTNVSFGNEDDFDIASDEDRIDCCISLSNVVTLKLLFFPVATLLTILGAPTLALPGGAPFITAFLSASIATTCLTPTPTSLTNDPTLPFVLKFKSTLRTSGFSVSSDTFSIPPRIIPIAGGKARS